VSHSGFKKYFFNTGWLMLDKVLRMFLGLFVGVWVARYLGPENFGILNFAMSFVGLFGAFGKLGLDGIIVRNIVREPDERDEILGTSLFLRLCGAIVLMLAVFGALQLTSTTTHEKIIVMIIAFGQLFMSFEVFDFYFQSQVKAKFSGITGTFGLLASSIARISFILLGLPLIWFAGAVIIEQLTKAIFFLFFYIKTASPIHKPSNNKDTNTQIINTDSKLNIKNLKLSKATAVALLKDSWPLILSGLVVMVYMRIDQVMIKEMLNNEAVGQYAAAVRISEAWYFIPIVITNSLFPSIVNAKKQSEDLYYTRLQNLYTFMVWMAIAVAVPMTFLSGWIINVLFGSEYSQAANVLKIHIWAGVFVFLGVAFSKFLISENFTKKAFARTFIGAIMNVSLNYFMIPKFGISGAAIATLLSQFTANYLYDFFDKDLRKHLIIKNKSFFPVYIIRRRL
jgi:O-antigen/teichoic acid export membrane protein